MTPLRTSLLMLPFAFACGRGDPSTSGPVGQPPVPASLTANGGDGQSAFPGQAVAVAPSVVVKDAFGRPMAGVPVSFTVSTGGGSVAGGNVTTSSSGEAAAGAWRLGTAGPQVLEASVASLPAVKFQATLSTGLVDGSLPPTGGTIAIETAGHPWRGLTLTVPSTAFSTAGTWRFELAPDVVLPPLPEDFTSVRPPLRVTTDQGRANALMTIRVPVARVPGAQRVAIFTDPARQVREVIPLVDEDSSGITLILGHLNAGLLLGPSAPAAARLGQPGSSTGVIQLTMYNALGFGTVINGFLSQDWPAPDLGSYAWPGGHGPALALLDVLGRVQGTSFSGLVRATPFGTLRDTATLATLQVIAGRDQAGGISQNVLTHLANAFAGVAPAHRDSITAINLWAGLAVSRLPQLMVHEGPGSAGPTSKRRVWSAVYGNANGATWFAAPSDPLVQSTLSLGPQGFASLLVREVADANPFAALRVMSLGGSFLYPVDQFLDVIPAMTAALQASGPSRDALNRALAQTAHFPDVTIEVRDAVGGSFIPADSEVVVRDSSAEMLVRCRNCPDALPQHGSATQQTVAIDDGSRLGATGATYGIGPRYTGQLLGALGVGNLTGAALTTMDPARTLSALASAWRVAVPIRPRVRLSLFRFVKDSVVTVEDSLQSLDVDIGVPVVGGYVIDWTYGDGTPPGRTTDTTALAHRYRTAGTYTLRAVLRRGPRSPFAGMVLASAAVKVVVKPPLYGWQFTIAALLGTTLPAGGIGPERGDTAVFNLAQQWMSGVQARPADHGVYLYGKPTGVAPSCTAWVALEEFPGGQVVFDSTLDAHFRGLLGSCGDPDLLGNVTMGPLDNGTLVADAVPDPAQADSVLVAPGGSISATMRGRTLSGTLVVNFRYSTGIGTYRFSFQGTRILP